MSGLRVSLVRDEDGSELLLGGPGEYVLGRGPVVKITDKRVSRAHALLSLEEDGTVKIFPKHSNPFFYRTAEADKFSTLSRNDWHTVNNKDKISFLPNELIYTIKVVKPPEALSSTETNERVGLNKTDTIGVTAAAESDSGRVPGDPPPLSSSISSRSSSSGKKRNLPSWMKEQSVITTSVKKKGGKSIEKQPTVARASKLEITSNSADDGPPVVRTKKTPAAKDTAMPTTATPTAEDIATPNETSKQKSREEDDGTGHSVAVMATPSTDEKDHEEREEEEKEEGPPTVTKKKKKLLPCPYGKKCYRKNPAHFNEFSHDSEEEEEEEEDKPECPYGTSCYRRNPVHRQQFKHTAPPAAGAVGTAGKKRLRTSTRAKKKTKKSALAGDSDDDGEANAYDYNDSFIDDEDSGDETDGSSSTSFDEDSDDETWAVPKEDLSELVSEAKSFMRNEKMQKTV